MRKFSFAATKSSGVLHRRCRASQTAVRSALSSLRDKNLWIIRARKFEVPDKPKSEGSREESCFSDSSLVGGEREGPGEPGLFKRGFKTTGAQLPQVAQEGLKDLGLGSDFFRFHEILKLELIHRLKSSLPCRDRKEDRP